MPRLTDAGGLSEAEQQKNWEVLLQDYFPRKEISGFYITTFGETIPVDVSSAAATIRVPKDPRPGDFFTVIDSQTNAATNNITVDFSTNSQLVRGASGDVTINIDGAVVRFRYINTKVGWIYNSFDVGAVSGLSEDRFDAKGDLLVGSSDNNATILSVGAENRILAVGGS